jgi:hypothetical protein
MARLSLLALVASWVSAAPIYVATQNFPGAPPGTFNEIGIVNPLTGVVSNVHTIRDALNNDLQMFDIATDLLGDIWGVDFNSFTSPNQRLFRINPATGIATLMATFSGLPTGANINGMDFNPATGLLYLSVNTFPNDPTVRLYSTDVNACPGSVCTLTNRFSGSLPNGSAGDIVFVNGQLFYGAENGTLYRLTESAGLWSLAAGTNTTNPLAQGTDNSFWGVTMKGLVYSDNKLYAGAIFHPLMPQLSPHGLIEINPVTMQTVGPTVFLTGTVHTLAGLTTHAVPEPGLFIPGALSFLFVLHRRRKTPPRRPPGEGAIPAMGGTPVPRGDC